MTAFAAAALPAIGRAQTPPQPSGGQLIPQVPQGSPLLRLPPTAPPAAAPALPAVPPAVPSATPPVQVVVRSIVVTGVTVVPEAEVQRLVGGTVGAQVPLARIEAARVALLDRYRNAGYPLTTVTAHLDAQGNLRFAVVEGYIAEVKLEGDIGPAATQVLRFLNHLTETRPIDLATLERWLLLASDVPGITIHSVLRPSADTPGALTLIAQVSRQAISAALSADNRAYPLTGPAEGLAVVDFNSFTEFGERTELSLYHASGNTQNFGQASTEFFVGGSGLKVRVYAGHGQTDPSGYLSAIGYEGITTVFGISASYPVIRSRDQTLNLHAYLDGIDSAVRPGLTAVDAFGHDNIRALRLGVDYQRLDLLMGGDRTAVNTATLRLSQGVPFLGGTASDSPNATRPNEQTNFTAISGELDRVQTLFSPWPGATVALEGLLTGQYSGAVLPPVEQFYLGGAQFTRGFYSGEALGDSAVAATIQLELNTTNDTMLFGRPLQINALWYLFYDWGEAWQNQPIEPNYRLSSEGAGVRLMLTRYAEFDLEGVIRNTRLPTGSPGAVKPLPADAVYWRVLLRY